MEELPYRRLVGWQKGYTLALEIMAQLEEPQFSRRQDLIRQMARCAMSVPANLAEGHGRGTPLDFSGFIDRARGSLFELDNWLLMCRDRKLIPPDRHAELQATVLEANAILWRLRESQREKSTRQRYREG